MDSRTSSAGIRECISLSSRPVGIVIDSSRIPSSEIWISEFRDWITYLAKVDPLSSLYRFKQKIMAYRQRKGYSRILNIRLFISFFSLDTTI